MIKPDILATIKLYSTEEKGRKGPTPHNFYSCIVAINGRNHDCRLLLNGIGSLLPGGEYDDVPIKFLCSDLVLPNIKIGDNFFVKEGHIIGEGTVISKS